MRGIRGFEFMVNLHFLERGLHATKRMIWHSLCPENDDFQTSFTLIRRLILYKEGDLTHLWKYNQERTHSHERRKDSKTKGRRKKIYPLQIKKRPPESDKRKLQSETTFWERYPSTMHQCFKYCLDGVQKRIIADTSSHSVLFCWLQILRPTC